jgi:hypothetical protein
MTTLSTRLSAATSFTDELREECARMLGWEPNGNASLWWQEREDGHSVGRLSMPELHLGEIVAEIERRGWSSHHWLLPKKVLFAIGDPVNHDICGDAHRPDRNIQLCAMTALAMALENDDD